MPQFEKRTKGLRIIKIANYEEGNVFIDFPIEESENVILHSGDCSVVVKNIQKESEDKFKGTVLGLEPPVKELNDIKAGDIISFTEDQVISASKGN